MTQQPESPEPVRIVVQAAEQIRRKQSRRTRKNLHALSPDQLVLFDPENPS